MWRPTPGDIVPYSYLWWREHEAGEETGRKVRPCVVIIAVKRVDGDTLRVAVVPITRSPPDGRASIEVPERVKQRLGLDAVRSWIICDEFNHFQWPGFDLDRTASGDPTYGRIPDTLLERVKAAVRSSNRKIVDRD